MRGENTLTSEAFADFVAKNGITDFYIAGADAVACVKSTCFNMCKAGYSVTVLSDCITSYDKRNGNAKCMNAGGIKNGENCCHICNQNQALKKAS